MNANHNPVSKVIHSESYGSISVTEEQIYHFPKGIIGLPEYQEYALIQFEDAPYNILHAVDEQLSFILLPPSLAVKDYGFSIDQAAIGLLNISKPEEVATFLIVNIVDDQMFVNLKAPVLLSMSTRKGCQFIIDDQDLPLRYPLSGKEGE